MISKHFLLFLPLVIPVSLFAGESADYDNSRYFQSNSVSVHYRVWLPASGEIKEKIFLVHGYCGSTYSWRNNIEEMTANNCAVVAVDLPPFGLSSKNSEFSYSFEEISCLFWSLLEEVDENMDAGQGWTLVGHSIGAGIVSMMAREEEEKTISLVIVDGMVGYRINRFTKFMLNSGVLKKGIKFAANNLLLKPSYIQKVLATAYGREPLQSEVDNYLSPLMQKDFLEAIFLFTKNFDAEIDLSEINIPVLLIWGEHDKWIKLPEARSIQSQFPDANLTTIRNASHCPMETNPDEFNAYLMDFIRLQAGKDKLYLVSEH